MSKEIEILPPETTAVSLYVDDGGVDKILKYVGDEARSQAANLDIKQSKDFAKLKSISYQLKRSKTFADGLGKDHVADIKEQVKLVDAERKKLRDGFDALDAEIRKPLEDELARIDGHDSAIAEMLSLENERDCSSASYAASLNWLHNFYKLRDWEEFSDKAKQAYTGVTDLLGGRKTAAEKAEAEAKELEELRALKAEQERKEREARIAAEAAEKAKQEAEAKAERERQEVAQAAERQRLAAEREAQRKVQEAEQKLADERKAIADAEAAKQAAEKAAQKAEQERIADIQHRRKIQREVLDSLIGYGVSGPLAVSILDRIDAGEVPNVKIVY